MCRKIFFCGILIVTVLFNSIWTHDAKDFDDNILYKIDFEMPDFDKNPELKNHIKTFYTHEHEKYDCVIPVVSDKKEEQQQDEPELSPLTLLQTLFDSTTCSFRIEAYWSYEICHGRHVRQYHEEREGKTTKFQEYYLGMWKVKIAEKIEALQKVWEEERKAGMKYKTTRIDNTKYPYYEIEMTDGTFCEITNAPRTTFVRYICYPHGKNEIYSFKETSSCNYEAIILTSALCMIPAFHPEESKEVSIKCYNSPIEPHKPLSMLRQELNDLQQPDTDVPISRDSNLLVHTIYSDGDNHVLLDKFKFLDHMDKVMHQLMSDGNTPASGSGIDAAAAESADSSLTAPRTEEVNENEHSIVSAIKNPLVNLSPIKEFVSGKQCLTGGTGWWRYEFCYGRYVRQFHKENAGETEIYLGYFSPHAHRLWVMANPEKSNKLRSSMSLWHHYEKGQTCERTQQPREVDVKLTCVSKEAVSPTFVSMYLLEPRTCQYILVVESPIVCDLLKLADEFGLVDEEKLQKLLVQEALTAAAVEIQLNETPSTQKKHNEQTDGITAKGDAHQQTQQSHAESLLNDETRT